MIRVDLAFRALPTSTNRTTTIARSTAVDMRASVYARQINRTASPPIYGCVI